MTVGTSWMLPRIWLLLQRIKEYKVRSETQSSFKVVDSLGIYYSSWLTLDFLLPQLNPTASQMEYFTARMGDARSADFIYKNADLLLHQKELPGMSSAMQHATAKMFSIISCAIFATMRAIRVRQMIFGPEQMIISRSVVKVSQLIFLTFMFTTAHREQCLMSLFSKPTFLWSWRTIISCWTWKDNSI